MSDDTSIDLVVFQIIAEREHGSLVATHEPSASESTQEVTLCTFDEISEIWFDDKDINQTLTLVQPRKVLIQRMLTQHHSCCQSFSVYLTLPDYLSEFEVPVRVHDLFPESVCEGFLLKNLLWYSFANHHHLIIIILSSSSSHHHLIIIIISSSSHHHHHHHHLSPLSLSLLLFFSFPI